MTTFLPVITFSGVCIYLIATGKNESGIRRAQTCYRPPSWSSAGIVYLRLQLARNSGAWHGVRSAHIFISDYFIHVYGSQIKYSLTSSIVLPPSPRRCLRKGAPIRRREMLRKPRLDSPCHYTPHSILAHDISRGILRRRADQRQLTSTI